jgi:hypothetical protein
VEVEEKKCYHENVFDHHVLSLLCREGTDRKAQGRSDNITPMIEDVFVVTVFLYQIYKVNNERSPRLNRCKYVS